ncbi:MAG TPA: redoxin [Micromonosporaceae bacterium]|nr:redoxin [Micromonosporaceae bacterium]HCU52240.1 redoxin [Micromonosporaceae bacterium]
MSRRFSLWPAFLAGLLVLGACAGPTAPTDDIGDLARDRDAAAAAGEVDLDFTVATLDGGTFDGKSLAGKPAVLWFWAPWCPTCAAEAPHVAQAATTYQGKIVIVGVAGLDELSAMHRFVELTKVDNIPHLADQQGVVWKRFGVTAQSTYVLLDATGAVVYRGYLSNNELDRRLTGLAG